MSLCNAKTGGALTLDCFRKTQLITANGGSLNPSTKWWITDPRQTGWKATMKWKLPANFECPNGCVMMWEYAAMQGCIERCGCAECGNSYCKENNPTVGHRLFCGKPGAHKVEYFRNCADVTIGGPSAPRRLQL